MVYAILAVYVAVLLVAGVITALKSKWGTLVVGLFSFAWLFGAVRLARPDSFWDRKFYDERQRQRAREVAAPRRRLAGATFVSRVETVEGDSLRVRGDNAERACDSRAWGPLPRDHLVAKVVFRYWPLDRLGTP
jgi:hypothetical protein